MKPGACGLFNPDDSAAPLPMYAVCDRRHDGRPRIVAEFADAQAAAAVADSLRAAGADVDVVLVTAVRN